QHQMGPRPCARNGKQSQSNSKEEDQDWSQGKVGKRKPEQAHKAQKTVIPAVAALCGANTRRQGQNQRKHQGCQGQPEGKGIALPAHLANILVQTDRSSQASVQDTLPVVDVLGPYRNIESVGVTGRLYIRAGRSFAQHGLNWITGNDMDKQEDD